MTDNPVWLFGDWLIGTFLEFGYWISEFGTRSLGIKSVINGKRWWKYDEAC